MFYWIFVLNLWICAEFCRKYLKNFKVIHKIPALWVYFLYAGFVVLLVLSWIFMQKTQWGWLGLYLIPLFLIVFTRFFSKRQEEFFLKILNEILTSTITYMKLGFGFMPAWKKSLQQISNDKLQTELEEITKALEFPGGFIPERSLWKNTWFHLLEIRTSSQALKRCLLFQRKLKIQVEFYQKLKKSLYQLKLQSWILTIIYSALLAWSFILYKQTSDELIAYSLVLFFIGLIWINQAGRGFSWSI